MMTPAQAIKEIDELINTNPLNWVDALIIVKKYTDENSLIGEQGQVRSTLNTALEDYRGYGYIKYGNNSWGLSTFMHGKYAAPSFLFCSTIQYEEKKKAKQVGDVFNQFIQHNHGIAIQAGGQSSVDADLIPATKPTQNPVAKKRNRIIANLQKAGSWIISHILLVILLGAIGSIIAAFFIYKFRWFQN